jgi:KilA-N domain
MNIPNEYKNLSTIAKASGKRLNKWVNGAAGKTAIADFKLKYPEIEYPLVTKKGRGGGTWGHPELAAIFAAWCNPQFTAEVVEQNVQLKEQNALLQEKIRTFQVNLPFEVLAELDGVEAIKQLAYKVEEKTEQEIELIAKCHFVQNIYAHPKGIAFDRYLPHWLLSMRERTDGLNIYPSAILDAMLAKTGQPARCQGKVLKPGCAGVWVAEIN